MATLDIVAAREGATTTLRLGGRLDASSAEVLAAAVPGDADLRLLILDLGACPFVSSGGIRVILTQHKRLLPRGGGVELVNVQPEVRRVFELSGLDQLVTVRDKLREISVEGLEFLSEGVFGEVFRVDDETIVKLYRQGVDPAVVEKEKKFSRAAFVAGVPTAISLDVVASGDRYGITYEMLGADSIAALMRRYPDQLDDHARLLAALARTIHDTQADPMVFPDIKADA
ncbi:MAG: anti-sigma factor antagonist [Gammaproteobacteria bacterium]|nr:anti-sigma factor antagonist [Gammaproteobacteria bacterium]